MYLHILWNYIYYLLTALVQYELGITKKVEKNISSF